MNGRISVAVFHRLVPALALLFCAACGEGPTPPDGLEIDGIVLTDAAGVVQAHSHADHWHGALEIQRDQPLELRIYLVSSGSPTTEPPPRSAWFTLQNEPEYTLRVTIADPTVMTWQGERYQATITGRRTATTTARIYVQEGDRTVYDASSVVVIVDP
ncbi:MAG TPA: hypothetical protein VGR27_15725 [Longimicrobiaceae bacterium]|nr:hypothetical protein [Longimicrobiaceae bacterium]